MGYKSVSLGQKLSNVNGALLGLIQFLVTEDPLQMMKNAAYFTLIHSLPMHPFSTL